MNAAADQNPERPGVGLPRRGVLAGMAGMSAAAMVGRMPAAAHGASEAGTGLHGMPLRGMYLTSKDRLAEGRFGSMFKKLPAFAPRDDLLSGLAATMVEDQTIPDDDNLNTSPRLFAGFTFIGQFIDHDITFDNTPLALQQVDPDARVNFRTPRYDLDSIYGLGPVQEEPPSRSCATTRTSSSSSCTRLWCGSTTGSWILPGRRAFGASGCSRPPAG